MSVGRNGREKCDEQGAIVVANDGGHAPEEDPRRIQSSDGNATRTVVHAPGGSSRRALAVQRVACE